MQSTPRTDNPLRCQARSKRTGEPCRAWAVKGWSVCRMHGAGGGRPIIHGRYSKELPQAIAKLQRARRQQAIEDLHGRLEPIVLDHLPNLARALDRLAEQGESPNTRMAIEARFAPIAEASQLALTLTLAVVTWVESPAAQAFYDRE